MAYKIISSKAIDIKKSEKGSTYEGVYVSKREIDTQLGKQSIWQFVDDDELPFGVYGFTNLNRAMESIKPGAKCRLTYQGVTNTKTKFGMKDVHQVMVEVDTDESDEFPALNEANQ